MEPASYEQWGWGLAYAMFSSSLLVVNKWVLTYLPAPNLLMALQAASTVLLIQLVGMARTRSFSLGWLSGTPFESLKKFEWFLACTVLQFVTIGSNMMALYYLGVDRVILLRIVAMIPIAFGDWLVNNRRLPSVGSWLCFSTLILAALFVFGHENADLTIPGVVWGFQYLLCITCDQVVLKKFTKAVPMNDSDRTFWINLLTVPIAAVVLVFMGEMRGLQDAELDLSDGLILVLSCFLGAGISYTAWGYRGRVSAVTFSLVGVVCKLGSMALNFALLPHVSPMAILLISLGILSTFFYEQAPTRDEEDARPRWPKKRAIAILVVVLLAGTAKVVQSTCTWDPSLCDPAANETLVPADPGYPAPSMGYPAPKDLLPLPLPRNTSWHRCVGRTAGPTPWRLKSCHLKSVCYDGNAAGELTYFADPLEQVTEADLSSGTMAPYVASDSRSKVREYKVRLLRQAIPEGVHWLRRESLQSPRRVLVPANYFLPAVWTHLVFDNLLPTYRLLETFGLDPEEVDVHAHWLQYPCDPSYHDGCDFSDRRYNPKWVQLMSTRLDVRFTQLQEAYNWTKGQWACFEDVVTGFGLFTDHGEGWSGHGRDLNQPVWTNFGSSASWWNFREWTLERAVLHARFARDPVRTGPWYDVLFLRKGNSTYNANAMDLDPIVRALVHQLNETSDPVLRNVTIAPAVFLEKYSLVDQMTLVSKAKVVISQVGSTSFGAFWLPRGSSLVLLHTNEQLDFYFWDNIAWIDARFMLYRDTSEATLQGIARAVISGLWRAQ
jgi:GDP-mannose transporter